MVTDLMELLEVLHNKMMRNRKALFLMLIILLLLLTVTIRLISKDLKVPYYTTTDMTPQWVKPLQENRHIIRQFSFTDQNGNIVTRNKFNDHITVVNFFFTSCPGICKKLTHGMKEVQTEFINDEKVLLLSHTVNPEKDNVSVLKQYADINGAIKSKWFFVTGQRSAIYNIARNSYYADEDMGWKRDSSTFLHTENILLIDKKHQIRGVYKGTIPLEIEHLKTDIKLLEEE